MSLIEEDVQTATEMSPFAESVYLQKYAWKDDEENAVEDWEGTALRVTTHVLGAIGINPGDPQHQRIFELIRDRKFMPGGRYLYASGRDLHQVQNCLLLKAEDSREGWAELLSNAAMALQTGAGIGVDYSAIRASGTPIKRTGGVASGPLSLMRMVNEVGRGVMQGGARRSAIWAGLNWAHGDAEAFIDIKNWSPELRGLKERDFNFPMEMEYTNISILLDDAFFAAYADEDHRDHGLAHRIYDKAVKTMLKTAEPGFSVDIGDNAGETLRNAPVTGETHVLTFDGYKPVSELVGIPTEIWTGHRYAEDVVFEKTQENAPIVKVEITGGRVIRCEPSHEFLVESYVGKGKKRQLEGIRRVAAKDLKSGEILHVSDSWYHDEDSTKVNIDHLDSEGYELGYIYGDGSFHQAGGVDLTLCSEESKALVGHFSSYSSINEDDSRGYTRMYFGVDERWSGRSKDVFPAEMFSADPLSAASFLAGLFDADGNYEPTQGRIRLASKHREFLVGVRRLLEQYGIFAGISKAGISTHGQNQGWQLVVMADSHDDFAAMIPTKRFKVPHRGNAYRASTIKVLSVTDDGFEDVYCADVKVPEHSFMAEGVIISNCTEVTSADDSDICNLGSINMSRIVSLDEMSEAVNYGTLFLLAGTVYSDLPYPKVDETRHKNRRLGLGVMGVHEWLVGRGYSYGPNPELGKWMEEYARSTEYAKTYADALGITAPVKTRAIAPTGTIGIVAETTTGIEPIFCVAYKRRVKTASASGPDMINYQYVIDPTAKRLIANGADPYEIEDAYMLSYNVEKRIAFQAWMQQYVDHGISSTINLPETITDPEEVKDFGDLLMDYLPRLRGMTVYPDGSRSGQPLSVVPYEVAAGQEGVVFEETEDAFCKSGSCGA